MKRALFIACAFAVFAAVPTFAQDAAKADNLHGPDQSVAVQMGYHTMANGSVIYEETPADAPAPTSDTANPADIAPAAGNDDNAPQIDPAAGGTENPSPAPTFHYDPLTQTYHRVTVDKAGNTSQDVINTAR